MSVDPVLVAVDFSASPRELVKFALEIARRGRGVRVLHVIEDALLPPRLYVTREKLAEFRARLVAQAQEKLDELARAFPGTLAREVVVGRPADEIVERSREAGLVVVGSHGRGARATLERVFLGSTAEEVARRSLAPVLVVPEGAPPIERVVVAVDVADPSAGALRAGAELARRLGVPLEAIHVIGWPLDAKATASSPDHELGAELAARLRDEAPRTLEELVRRETDAEFAAEVVEGDPATELLRRVRPGDVLACGTHARGPLQRLAFGSVATKLLRAVKGRVLVVPPPAPRAG